MLLSLTKMNRNSSSLNFLPLYPGQFHECTLVFLSSVEYFTCPVYLFFPHSSNCVTSFFSHMAPICLFLLTFSLSSSCQAERTSQGCPLHSSSLPVVHICWKLKEIAQQYSLPSGQPVTFFSVFKEKGGTDQLSLSTEFYRIWRSTYRPSGLLIIISELLMYRQNYNILSF